MVHYTMSIKDLKIFSYCIFGAWDLPSRFVGVIDGYSSYARSEDISLTLLVRCFEKFAIPFKQVGSEKSGIVAFNPDDVRKVFRGEATMSEKSSTEKEA